MTPNEKEQIHEVQHNHPEIVSVLKRLYRSAYNSGFNTEQGDGYDWSTAYYELKPILAQRDKEIRKEIIATIEDLLAKKQKHPCQYQTPRGETANNYDCSDVHIGHEEFARDLIEALTNN